MTNEELLQEMESLVEAIEQSLAITIGAVAASGDPVTVLRHVLRAEQAMSSEFGPNAWRDRLVRKLQIVSALIARPHATDPSLQQLIATLLKPQTGPDQTH